MIKICPICELPIEGDKSNQKVHQGECKRIWNNQKKCATSRARHLLKSPVVTRICPVCGEQYLTRKRTTLTCQNVACKNAYQRKKISEKLKALPEVERAEFYHRKYMKYDQYKKRANPKQEDSLLKKQTVTCKCPGCEEVFEHEFETLDPINTAVVMHKGCSDYPRCVNRIRRAKWKCGRWFGRGRVQDGR